MEEAGRKGDGSLGREVEEGAWLAGGGTIWDLRLEEGVVELFWVFLLEVEEAAAAWDWRLTPCS